MSDNINIGVIPAAGKGTRLSDLPLTKVLPKVMLPILNKPILEYNVKIMKKMGITEIFIIINDKKQIIMDYFGDGSEFGIKINYVLQPNLLGIADAIDQVSKFLTSPFIVILGDSFIINDNICDAITQFRRKQAYAVECVIEEHDVESIKRSCNVSMNDDNQIIELIEKPQTPKTNLRGMGIYVLHPIIFEYITKTQIAPPRNEREITNTLMLMAQQTGRVYASPFRGKEININKIDDLINATKLMLAVNNDINLNPI